MYQAFPGICESSQVIAQAIVDLGTQVGSGYGVARLVQLLQVTHNITERLIELGTIGCQYLFGACFPTRMALDEINASNASQRCRDKQIPVR